MLSSIDMERMSGGGCLRGKEEIEELSQFILEMKSVFFR